MADQEEYLAKVHAYDPGADAAVVKKIVSHLGIALQSRDSSLVACSDDDELIRIRDGFCKKKLGLDAAHSDDAIMAVLRKVCQEMSGDGGNKHRVPFYYLVAKHTGTLDKI